LCGLLFFQTLPEESTALLLRPLESWPKESVVPIHEGLFVIFESWVTAYAFVRIAQGHAIYVAALRYVVDPEEPIIAIKKVQSRLYEPGVSEVARGWERFNAKSG